MPSINYERRRQTYSGFALPLLELWWSAGARPHNPFLTMQFAFDKPEFQMFIFTYLKMSIKYVMFDEALGGDLK